MMSVNLEERQGSPCQIYDHAWRPTSVQGRYECRTCGVLAYCRECMPTVPSGAITMHCEKHQEGQRNA